jgi:hypothetical protein
MEEYSGLGTLAAVRCPLAGLMLRTSLFVEINFGGSMERLAYYDEFYIV